MVLAGSQVHILLVESHPSHHSEWAEFIELIWTMKCLKRILVSTYPFPQPTLTTGMTSSLIRNAVPLFSVLTMIYNAHSMLINLLVWTQSQLLY